MGLLDIWNDWKKDNQGQTDGFQDYLPITITVLR